METIKITCTNFLTHARRAGDPAIPLCWRSIFTWFRHPLCSQACQDSMAPYVKLCLAFTFTSHPKSNVKFLYVMWLKGKQLWPARINDDQQGSMTDGGSLVTRAVKTHWTSNHQRRRIRPLPVWKTPWWDSHMGQTAMHGKGRYCLPGCRTWHGRHRIVWNFL